MSEPEITDEMVEAGRAALEEFCGPNEVANDTTLIGFDWSEEALVCLAAALPHSPLLAENKALRDRIKELEAEK